MRIEMLPTGDPVHRYQKCIVIPFAGKRRVLSTCSVNGGFREDLTAVFNNDINPGAGMECQMLAPSYEEHLTRMAEHLGLDPKTAAGMATAASMENVSIQKEAFGATEVTAVVTGGIEVNGGRVGDPADWDEAAGEKAVPKSGTINIILSISTDLTPGALARALVTCTEAKTAALQELLAASRYSSGIATGSGTDGTIVICNAESDLCLTNAGKHSKLGELIGKAVKSAVKEALRRQSGLSQEGQHDLLRRTERFGVTEQTLWEWFQRQEGSSTRADFAEQLYQLSQDGEWITGVSLYVHLMDQLQWGLLSSGEAVSMGRKILGLLPGNTGEFPAREISPEHEPAAERMIRELKAAICSRMAAREQRNGGRDR